MDQDLPKLNQFILPGGGVASAHVHMARTAVRHAERIMYPLVRESQLNGEVAIYFNRYERLDKRDTSMAYVSTR